MVNGQWSTVNGQWSTDERSGRGERFTSTISN